MAQITERIIAICATKVIITRMSSEGRNYHLFRRQKHSEASRLAFRLIRGLTKTKKSTETAEIIHLSILADTNYFAPHMFYLGPVPWFCDGAGKFCKNKDDRKKSKSLIKVLIFVQNNQDIA